MATTTYGTNTTATRSNNSLYWVIGIVLIVAIITFFAWREKPVTQNAPVTAPVESVPMESAPSTTTDMNGAGTVDRSTTTTPPVEEQETAPATPATPE